MKHLPWIIICASLNHCHSVKADDKQVRFDMCMVKMSLYFDLPDAEARKAAEVICEK